MRPDPFQIAVGLVLLSALAASFGASAAILLRWAGGHPPLRREAPRPVPWGGASVAGVALAFLGLNQLSLELYVLLARDRPPTAAAPLTSREQILVVSLASLALLALVPLLLRRTSGAGAADLGLAGRPIGRNLARGLVACLVVAPWVYAVNVAALRHWSAQPHEAAKALRADHSPSTLALVAGSAVLLAPAVEELIFRGVLLGWLLRLGRRPDPPESPPGPDDALAGDPAAPKADAGTPADWALQANVMTSFVFAGLHEAQWPAPVPLFFLSLALGVLYTRTGSLVACFALHAGFNAISTAFMIALVVSGHDPAPAPPPEPPAPKVRVARGKIDQDRLAAPDVLRYHSLPRSTHRSDAERLEATILQP